MNIENELNILKEQSKILKKHFPNKDTVDLVAKIHGFKDQAELIRSSENNFDSLDYFPSILKSPNSSLLPELINIYETLSKNIKNILECSLEEAIKINSAIHSLDEMFLKYLIEENLINIASEINDLSEIDIVFDLNRNNVSNNISSEIGFKLLALIKNYVNFDTFKSSTISIFRTNIRYEIIKEYKDIYKIKLYIKNTTKNSKELNLPENLITEFEEGYVGLTVLSGSLDLNLREIYLNMVCKSKKPNQKYTESSQNSEWIPKGQKIEGYLSKLYHPAIQAAMRSDPDVILIGSQFTEDNKKEVIMSIESGHKVVVYVHSNSLKRTIEKINSYLPEETKKDSFFMNNIYHFKNKNLEIETFKKDNGKNIISFNDLIKKEIININ